MVLFILAQQGGFNFGSSTEQHQFPMVLFIMLYMLALGFGVYDTRRWRIYLQPPVVYELLLQQAPSLLCVFENLVLTKKIDINYGKGCQLQIKETKRVICSYVENGFEKSVVFQKVQTKSVKFHDWYTYIIWS